MARRGLEASDASTLLLRKLVQNALSRQAAELVGWVVNGAVVRWQVAA